MAQSFPRRFSVGWLLLAAWQSAGGGLMGYFSSIDQWSKGGSWGALQYHDEDPATSPKWMAVMRWAKSLGQKVDGEK